MIQLSNVCKRYPGGYDALKNVSLTLADGEMRELIRQLEQAAVPHTCPHGRPTMVHLNRGRLEKEFGRS